MKNLQSSVKTSLGDIVVTTQYAMSWGSLVVAVLTLGLYHRGWHTGTVTGTAIGAGRTKQVLDHEAQTGQQLSDAAKQQATENFYFLTPEWGKRQLRLRYHQKGVVGANTFARTIAHISVESIV